MTHPIGHTLQQLTNMEKDCQRSRARFIAKNVELREELSFASPDQILRAVQFLCSDAYGIGCVNLSKSDHADHQFTNVLRIWRYEKILALQFQIKY